MLLLAPYEDVVPCGVRYVVPVVVVFWRGLIDVDVDASILGLFFLVPLLNWIAMLVLAALPSARSGSGWGLEARGPYRAPERPNAPENETAPDSLPRREMHPGLKATLIGMSRNEAESTCRRLKKQRQACLVIQAQPIEVASR